MNEMHGYTPKDLYFGEDGREKLIIGMEKMARAVGSTLGAMGRTVLIESADHLHGITVTKDGVTVAKAISLIDPVENLAVRVLREAADKTSLLAGDGTTTAIVLAHAIVLATYERIQFARDINQALNLTELLRELQREADEVIAKLRKESRRLNKRLLRAVATVSANNDTYIGGIIAGAHEFVGKDGIVTVDKSQTSSTYYETTDGIRLKTGFTSHYFITDHKRDQSIYEDVLVLVCEQEISSLLNIEKILVGIHKEGKKLLIISPLSNNMVNTLAVNVIKNNLMVCNIAPPAFGYKQTEIMGDLALRLGAKHFSEKTGDDLSLIQFEDLGFAAKVIVGRNETVIIPSTQRPEEREAIDARLANLRAALAEQSIKAAVDHLRDRISILNGKIGVIYVGGNTDLEQKELYDRVDDAICATRSALEEGIVAGGGVALLRIALSYSFPSNNRTTHHRELARGIMADALLEPIKEIFGNAGLPYKDSFFLNTDANETTLIGKAHGCDVRTGDWGDMIKMGIVDPLKVTRVALQNAVSVAITILSTDSVITLARSYETK